MSAPNPANEPEKRIANYASKKGEIVIRPHEFDGIQEFDQKMPNWWLFIFFSALIFFFALWIGYYQLGLMRPDEVVLKQQLAAIESKKAKELESMLATLNDSSLVNKWATDPAVVERGMATYLANCTACHGADLTSTVDIGGGKTAPLPGRSLMDGTWEHGGKPMDIFNLINKGTPPESPGLNGARMEAWGQKLPPIQIAELAAYILSKNPTEFTAEKYPAP